MKHSIKFYLDGHSVLLVHLEVGNQFPDFFLGAVDMVLELDHVVVLDDRKKPFSSGSSFFS